MSVSTESTMSPVSLSTSSVVSSQMRCARGAIDMGASFSEDASIASSGAYTPTKRQAPSPPSSLEVLKQNRVARFPHITREGSERSQVNPALEEHLVRLIREVRFNDCYDLLCDHLYTKQLLVTCLSLNEAVRTRNVRLSKTLILYTYTDFTPVQENPLVTAVLLGDVRLIKLLLLAPITDLNKGFPLVRAVENCGPEVVRLLAANSRINPNKGGALQKAVARDMQTFEPVFANPRLNVNRLCGTVGSTALCEAIEKRNIPAVRLLLTHPKIEVNKGFFLTPLQVALSDPEPSIAIVSMLLEKNSYYRRAYGGSSGSSLFVDVNRKLGESSSPLVMALECAQTDIDILELLLQVENIVADSKDVIRALEHRHDPAAEELFAKYGKLLKLGDTWQRHTLSCTMDFALLFIFQTLLAVLLFYLFYDGHDKVGVLVLALWLCGNLASISACVYTAMKKERKEKHFIHKKGGAYGEVGLVVRVLPVVYDVRLVYATLRAILSLSCGEARHALFVKSALNARTQAVFVCLPQSAALLALFLTAASPRSPLVLCVCVCTALILLKHLAFHCHLEDSVPSPYTRSLAEPFEVTTKPDFDNEENGCVDNDSNLFNKVKAGRPPRYAFFFG